MSQSSQNILGSQDSSIIRSIFDGVDDVDDDDDCLIYYDIDEGKNDNDDDVIEEEDVIMQQDDDIVIELEEGEVLELEDIMSNKQAFYKFRTDVYDKTEITKHSSTKSWY